MIFLANRDRYTQRTLLREIHSRLSKQAGCENVRYHPSSRRPRYVFADIDTESFLNQSYDVENARLEIRFWYPIGVDYEYYRINWIEPTRNLMLGFHQDADHPELGPCHIQLNYEDTAVERHAAASLDAHPLAALDKRLQQLPSALETIRWQDGRPSLPEWSDSE
ncbi:hypothetical protein SAMN04487948_11734 [Halogranum amylolyticum]|uniref:Uncharacterized protein n=1 Tax=Halogranum amylolyticum TaxID=660520 RepID=A0A1H8VKR9_9EURY|nr:hypothetical protein SAMN04487948_11734 [Halogranum amylolyticum]